MIDKLKAVGNLTGVSTSSAIYLTWRPPFSLNLTTAEPDIVYCIDIKLFNITNGEDHLVSNCSVFNTHYNFIAENPDPLYHLRVTPRSNVEGAKNGTPSVINITLSFESKLLHSFVCIALLITLLSKG